MIRRSILLLTIALAPALHAARVELPIREVDLSDGTRRYAVPITVGGIAMEAGLDTGSTGLRVLAPRLPDVPKGGASVEASFGSGLRTDGHLARMTIAFGNTTGSVPVEVIDKLTCTPLHPDCAAKKLGISDFGIQGDGLKGEGFSAILGLNMAPNPTPNPFTALSVTRWIIELPRPGEAKPGRLILDPDESELSGFTTIPLMAALADRTGGVHDSVPGCLVRTDTNAKLCGPVMFDSGAPGIHVSLDTFRGPWPAQTPGQLVLGGKARTIGIAFAAQRRDQATGMFAEQLAPGGVPHISVGLMPYFAWSILYDAKAETIGLKPR